MDLDDLRARAVGVEHGFAPLVALSKELKQDGDPLAAAGVLWRQPEHQLRMIAVILWGDFAFEHPDLLGRLRDEASADPDWRVQEMLARSLTTWCTTTGWETALPTLRSWLADERPNVRRAATEGPRVWTSRDYFRARPAEAASILRAQLDDPDPYARRSAENALRDVVKRFPDLA